MRYRVRKSVGVDDDNVDVEDDDEDKDVSEDSDEDSDEEKEWRKLDKGRWSGNGACETARQSSF
jgi:hypothetical protein